MGEKKAAALKLLAQLVRKSPEELREDMELVGDLGLDSPKALQLLVELEESLDVEIDDDVATRLNTVGDVLGLVDSLGGAPCAPPRFATASRTSASPPWRRAS